MRCHHFKHKLRSDIITTGQHGRIPPKLYGKTIAFWGILQHFPDVMMTLLGSCWKWQSPMSNITISLKRFFNNYQVHTYRKKCVHKLFPDIKELTGSSKFQVLKLTKYLSILQVACGSAERMSGFHCSFWVVFVRERCNSTTELHLPLFILKQIGNSAAASRLATI